MTDSTHHGDGNSPTPAAGEPTLAERSRTLMALGGTSSLATMSRKHPGYPYASVMPYATDGRGNPLFLISQMAIHTKNIRDEPRATLLVAEQAGTSLGAARISIMGDVHEIGEDEKPAAIEAYLLTHPESRQWAGFGDFAMYQLQIKDIYFIGGFGVMGWVPPEDYAAASPDPLAIAASEIMEHMNEDHVESMIGLVQHHFGDNATAVQMTAIDRYGFNLFYQTDEGVKPARLPFPSTVDSPAEVRTALIQMVKASH